MEGVKLTMKGTVFTVTVIVKGVPAHEPAVPDVGVTV
jgi:hypothetical protein